MYIAKAFATHCECIGNVVQRNAMGMHCKQIVKAFTMWYVKECMFFIQSVERTSDVEEEAGSGSTKSGYFLWKRKRIGKREMNGSGSGSGSSKK